MGKFEQALQSLVAKEAAEAGRANDHERLGAMVENLARALGFTVAVATKGNPRAIDEMIEGATAYAHEEAVAKSRFALLFESIAMPRPSTGGE